MAPQKHPATKRLHMPGTAITYGRFSANHHNLSLKMESF